MLFLSAGLPGKLVSGSTLTSTGSQDKQESCAALSNVTAEEIAEAQQFRNNFSKLASPRGREFFTRTACGQTAKNNSPARKIRGNGAQV
jgi:hypothetical protein